MNFHDETHQYVKTIKFITQNISVNHNKYEQSHTYDKYNYNSYKTINGSVNPYDDTVIKASIDEVAYEQTRAGLLNVATETKLNILINLLFPNGLPGYGGPSDM